MDSPSLDFKLPCLPKQEKANLAVASPSGDIRVRPYVERTYSVQGSTDQNLGLLKFSDRTRTKKFLKISDQLGPMGGPWIPDSVC